MAKVSAGILLYRFGPAGPEVLLIHPGGPYWAKKDDGAWSIPKGLVDPGEDEFAAARREFFEETGAIQETMRRARAYADDAKAALAVLPQSAIRGALAEIADFCVERAY